MLKSSRKPISGFTIIECLAVSLIILAMMALVIPLFLNAMSDSKRSQCRKNMIAIANAEREYKLKMAGSATIGQTPTYASSIATLQTKVSLNVTCPTTGTYQLSSTDSFVNNFTVSCTLPEHNAGYGSQPSG